MHATCLAFAMKIFSEIGGRPSTECAGTGLWGVTIVPNPGKLWTPANLARISCVDDSGCQSPHISIDPSKKSRVGSGKGLGDPGMFSRLLRQKQLLVRDSDISLTVVLEMVSARA